jgi:hypothetical protein
MCKECSKCGELGTPWYFCPLLEGHICSDCYYEIYGEDE